MPGSGATRNHGMLGPTPPSCSMRHSAINGRLTYARKCAKYCAIDKTSGPYLTKLPGLTLALLRSSYATAFW